MGSREDRVKGILLTRSWRDERRGLVLEYWLATEDGPLRVEVTRERAVFFVPRGTAAHADERRAVELTDLRGAPVDALYFNRYRDALEARDRLRAAGEPLLESDVKPHDRFLMERFCTGGCEVVGGRSRQRDGYREVLEPRLRRAEPPPIGLRVLSLDIETDGIDGPVISVALVEQRHTDGERRDRVIIVGHGSTSPSVQWCGDEATLLQATNRAIRERDPDLIVGWNVVGFDLMHLERRCAHHGIPFRIGRGRGRATVLAAQSANQLPLARVDGRCVVDGIRALETATYRFESFALDHVAHAILGEGKTLEAQGHDKVRAIQELYREDPAALIEYNRRDAELVLAIFERTRLVDFLISRQQMTGLPMSRSGGSVAAFDHLYLPRLHRAGCVAADVGSSSRTLEAPGGIVLASEPGLYRNVIVLDFKSLYPSIIRTFCIDPKGLAFPGDDPIEGFDGASFAREGAILPALIEELWRARDEAKAAGDGPRSQALKIVMNSFYGVLGTPGCRFYDGRLASSITRRGHEVIRQTQTELERRGHHTIYGDTDSLFLWLGDDRPAEGCRQLGTDIAVSMNAWWRDKLQREHRIESILELEFEVHYTRFYMPTLRGSDRGSAKRYAGLIGEGDDAQLVIKGLEAVRTDWTPLARRFQRELLGRVFRDEPLVDWLRAFKRDMFAGELDDELVYQKRLRRAVEEYRHQIPPHVRAAQRLGRPVSTVRYVMTHRGPEPVAMREGPIDYHHYLERQLAPAAEGILSAIGESFDHLVGDQLGLFG
ncbi:MAG: DNA polymerase II [Myxococcota bacterium]